MKKYALQIQSVLVKQTGNVIFYNLNPPSSKYNYYNSDGELAEKEFTQRARNIHELVGHPRDHASINEHIRNNPNTNDTKIEYIIPSWIKYVETDEDIVYFENQYVHFENIFKIPPYILQPFYKSESTTLIMEKLVNDQDFGERPENRRFYYDDNLKGKELYFNTKEELEEYFKK